MRPAICIGCDQPINGKGEEPWIMPDGKHYHDACFWTRMRSEAKAPSRVAEPPKSTKKRRA